MGAFAGPFNGLRLASLGAGRLLGTLGQAMEASGEVGSSAGTPGPGSEAEPPPHTHTRRNTMKKRLQRAASVFYHHAQGPPASPTSPRPPVPALAFVSEKWQVRSGCL